MDIWYIQIKIQIVSSCPTNINGTLDFGTGKYLSFLFGPLFLKCCLKCLVLLSYNMLGATQAFGLLLRALGPVQLLNRLEVIISLNKKELDCKPFYKAEGFTGSFIVGEATVPQLHATY